MRILILVGFRGVGKTRCGEILARLMGWNFFDTDRELNLKGESILSYVDKFGMAQFREEERAAIETVLASADRGQGAVIACGGGFVENPETVTFLRNWVSLRESKACVVWVKAPFAQIEQRLGQDSPRAGGHLARTELLALFESRLSIYESLAQFELLSEEKKLVDLEEYLQAWLHSTLSLEPK